jgi:cation:H+ antiporter
VTGNRAKIRGMTIFFFLLGLATLVIGAELLVRGAGRLATSIGISPLVVGLTIVAFGTSAPEIAVSTIAVLDGKTDLSIGNVVGSNIFNVLFILGVSALITPLQVHLQIIRQEVPILMGASVLLFVLVLDQHLSMLEAGLLLATLLAYTVFLIRESRRETLSQQAAEGYVADTSTGWDSSMPVQLLLIVGGLVLLVVGSQWLVDAAVIFAKALGVSDVVIGLTIVAAGTSLPEVATSVMAAIKGERDIAVGNVIGSCTFNILGCLGVAGLVSVTGLPIPTSVMNFDLWVMLATTIACIPIFLTGREIARWEGGVFLGYYVAYATYLILAAQQHDSLQTYTTVMLSFVIPITIVTLVAVMLRKPNAPQSP